MVESVIDKYYSIIESSYLFDKEWYREKYLKGGIEDPIIHYLAFGWRANYNPSPEFDTGWYLERYNDVKMNGMNPLAHYILFGMKENRLPYESFDFHTLSPYQVILHSGRFDMGWFSKYYSIDPSDVNLIEYYLENYHSGLNPSLYFDTLWYLNSYEDVRTEGINPFVHYILYGKEEGRMAKHFPFNSKYYDDYMLILESGFFDRQWFSKRYSLERDMDPIIYYLENWESLDMNPSHDFDTQWYLNEYSDVSESHMNPLVHYLKIGVNENRLPKQNSMRNLVSKIVEINFEDIENLEPIMNERYGLVVHYKSVQYDFLIDIKSNSNNLFVFASGVIPKEEYQQYYNRPVFKRQSWDLRPEMTESTIYFNDPTRYTYKELRGGWGIGSPNDYYLENVALILSKLFSLYDYSNENVIFYSSSMGGFMSIQLATMLPGTVAWADIPQTDLNNFFAYTYWKNIFENRNIEDYMDRIKCIELIKKYEVMPKIFLNIDCFFSDLVYQFYPFINDLQKLDFYKKENLKVMINPIEVHQFLWFDQFVALKNDYFSRSNDFDRIPALSVLEDKSLVTLYDNDDDVYIADLIHDFIISGDFNNFDE